MWNQLREYWPSVANYMLAKQFYVDIRIVRKILEEGLGHISWCSGITLGYALWHYSFLYSGLSGMLRIQLGLAPYNTSILPNVLSYWPSGNFNVLNKTKLYLLKLGHLATLATLSVHHYPHHHHKHYWYKYFFILLTDRNLNWLNYGWNKDTTVL